MAEFPFQEVATDPEKFRLFVVENLSILKTQMSDLHRIPDRVTVLETQMNGLVGANGTSGRIGTIEKDVKDIREDYQRNKGVLVGISVVVSAIVSFVGRFFKAG